ncbi:MAG: hypothetical protein ACLTDF_10915 [Coprococcus sp.]
MLVQRLAKADAYGPVTGYRKPVNTFKRLCS